MVNTVILITSANTFNWNRLNGPPLPENPNLFAGIKKIYSTRAMLHDNKIIAYNGQFFIHPRFSSWMWPYHANVMNTFEMMSNIMVRNFTMQN